MHDDVHVIWPFSNRKTSLEFNNNLFVDPRKNRGKDPDHRDLSPLRPVSTIQASYERAEEDMSKYSERSGLLDENTEVEIIINRQRCALRNSCQHTANHSEFERSFLRVI